MCHLEGVPLSVLCSHIEDRCFHTGDTYNYYIFLIYSCIYCPQLNRSYHCFGFRGASLTLAPLKSVHFLCIPCNYQADTFSSSYISLEILNFLQQPYGNHITLELKRLQTSLEELLQAYYPSLPPPQIP